jgi:hypothetical protein
MHILSFDVGIKHLAYCLILLEEETSTLTIADWSVIDLCNTDEHLCSRPGCQRHATYYKKDDYFCKTHAKRHEHYIMPTSNTSIKHLRACKIHELRKIWSETDISSNLTTRRDIFEALRSLYERTVLDTVQKINASK